MCEGVSGFGKLKGRLSCIGVKGVQAVLVKVLLSVEMERDTIGKDGGDSATIWRF